MKMSSTLDALSAGQIVSVPSRWIARTLAHDGRPMRMCRVVPLLLCALISQSGCIVLPIPTQEKKVLEGTPVAEEQLAFLVLGVTTKNEVTARLGSPDVIWEEARLFAYNWAMRQGVLVWAVGGGYSGAAGMSDIPKRYMLLIQFDEQDRVRRFERAVRPSHKSYGDFLEEWVGNSGKRSSGRSNPGQG
jgi:outer membrane protein assembly factor BamE (lipoprotein component of BamABCDE complex)